MNDLALINPDDPSEIGFPPNLPLEIALREHPVKDICEAYGVDHDRWLALRQNPLFKAAVAKYVDILKKEGTSFKLKAMLQSEAMLKLSWRLAHDPDTPANVRADLIKSTFRAAGYDKQEVAQGPGNAFQININLG